MRGDNGLFFLVDNDGVKLFIMWVEVVGCTRAWWGVGTAVWGVVDGYALVLPRCTHRLYTFFVQLYTGL